MVDSSIIPDCVTLRPLQTQSAENERGTVATRLGHPVVRPSALSVCYLRCCVACGPHHIVLGLVFLIPSSPAGHFSWSSFVHLPVCANTLHGAAQLPKEAAATLRAQLTGPTVSMRIRCRQAVGRPPSQSTVRCQDILTQLLGFGLNFPGRSNCPT